MMDDMQGDITPKKDQPFGLLFGTLAYDSLGEYEDFLKRLDENHPNDLLLALFSSLRYAQAHGVYTPEESEVVAILMRRFQTIVIDKLIRKDTDGGGKED